MTEFMRQSLNARLHHIAKENGGSLTADAVIDDARNPDSPLHNSFEWNIDRAAYRHWVATANRIINGYRVEVTVDSRTLSAPVYVRSPEQPKRYVPVDSIVAERDIALSVLRREIERVQAAVARMQGVAAALGLSDRVNDLSEAARTVAAAA